MRLLENEDELLQRARRGDLKAFHRIYDAYKSPVMTFLYRMTGNREDAEDLLQEVFVKAYRRLGSFRGESAFSTWLFSIAKNETFSFLRRNSRHSNGSLDAQASAGWENDAQVPVVANPEEDVLGRETERIMQEALNSLPETYRSAFVLGVIEGLPYEEVGKILGCSVPNVKSRVFRARAKLAKWLSHHYPEFGKPATHYRGQNCSASNVEGDSSR